MKKKQTLLENRIHVYEVNFNGIVYGTPIVVKSLLLDIQIQQWVKYTLNYRKIKKYIYILGYSQLNSIVLQKLLKS